MVMTMRELAKLCNVSISTVSKAFLDADDVSSNTKKHIFEIAKENGCYGKFYKGKYHKKIIGVICPELEGLYYTGFITELKRLMEKSDFSHSSTSNTPPYCVPKAKRLAVG